MIEYLNLKKITAMHHDEIMDAVAQVVDSGWYLQGEANARFEQQYARYIGTQHCVGCANGLDALTLIFRAYKQMGVLRDGDEVIVSANTYIASILSITENGLKPVLVEPEPDRLQLDDTRIEEAITPRTRAILLVHLYGRNAYTAAIGQLCSRYRLNLIEDNAQAQGCSNSKFRIQNSALAGMASCSSSVDGGIGEGRKAAVRTGAIGDAAAHSFYPGKNLGALGDAGAVTTDDAELAAMIRAMGNYGSSRKYVFPYLGRNSRLDEIQAAVLSVKLHYLDRDNARRKAIASHYYSHVDNPVLSLPGKAEWAAASPADAHGRWRDEDCVYHVFPVLCSCRDELQQYLAAHGIGTMIHYPIPPHQQACYKDWNSLHLPITEYIHQSELSIPCNPTLTDAEVEEVCYHLNAFAVK